MKVQLYSVKLCILPFLYIRLGQTQYSIGRKHFSIIKLSFFSILPINDYFRPKPPPLNWLEKNKINTTEKIPVFEILSFPRTNPKGGFSLKSYSIGKENKIDHFSV